MGNDVKVFKFINGEEVIARVVAEVASPVTGEKTGDYEIERPLALMAQPDHSTGQVRLGFAPWLIGNDKINVIIRGSSLALDPFAPNVDLEKGYLQSTSGIAIAGADAIK